MKTFQPPPRDDNEDEDSLAAAQKKLSEIQGRPFDIDRILAENRAREEREQLARKKIEEKLEREVDKARAHRHELRAREVESVAVEIEEKQRRFNEEKLRFAKGKERAHTQEKHPGREKKSS